MKKLFQALALLAAFVLLIALPQAAADGVRSALTLCGRVILPSLFPFFVCSNLFLLLGYSARLSARFGGAAAKLLRLPPAAGSAFLLGLLGGYPGRRAGGGYALRARGADPERTRSARLPSVIRRGRRSSSAYSAARSSKARRQAHFCTRCRSSLPCSSAV